MKRYPVPILGTEKPGSQVKHRAQSMAENRNSSSGVPVTSVPLTPPFFLAKEAIALRLVFTAHSLTSLNYSVCFCRTVGLLANGQGWQKCHGTAGKGCGVWKPPPRPFEMKQRKSFAHFTIPAISKMPFSISR